MLITNKWNSVFPLNIVIVFAIICLAAYLLFFRCYRKISLRWRFNEISVMYEDTN